MKRNKVDEKDTNQTKRSTTANDTRISLSTAYARNTEAKADNLNKKLAEDRRQWNAKQEAESHQRAVETEQRKQEYEERRSVRKHELVLELLRQNKTEKEIEAFLRLFG